MRPVRILGPDIEGHRISTVAPVLATPNLDGSLTVRDSIGQRWTFDPAHVEFLEDPR